VVLVLNKCDLPEQEGWSSVSGQGWTGVVRVSAETGEGEDRLSLGIAEALGLGAWADETPAVWTTGQRALLAEAIERLPAEPGLAVVALRRMVDDPHGCTVA
jgi:tRNA U34 5-carboxymethylaminomethyl modifying GTPase MnmE/TrmE